MIRQNDQSHQEGNWEDGPNGPYQARADHSEFTPQPHWRPAPRPGWRWHGQEDGEGDVHTMGTNQ